MADNYSTPITELTQDNNFDYNDTDTMNMNAKMIAEKLNQELQTNKKEINRLNNVVESKNAQVDYLTNSKLESLQEFDKNEYITLIVLMLLIFSPQLADLLTVQIPFTTQINPIILLILKTALVIGLFHVIKKLIL